MTDLEHAVSFLQGAYTIILALALTEGFKQFVADSGEPRIYWNKTPALVGFLFMIFPFFHGMSRYLYTSYLKAPPKEFAGHLMFDGIMFMLMSACFFVMSRSFPPDRWKHYYASMACLLLVDASWTGFVLIRGVNVSAWLVLDCIVAAVLLVIYLVYEGRPSSKVPQCVAATTLSFTTVISYFLMQDFYFP